ncbi:MAG TPA: 2-oxoacid:acceptor oxidoreductase subunit alpha [Candidatus Methanoperedens sp.]|nr:2-oxoacid:acceptor oxidoreductase subunit alpha [Candidatus Methanoperedens sp.]
MDGSTANILIGGEAGQGLVTVGQLLSKALVRAGWDICVTQGYQSRVRGGHNTWAVRFGAGGIGAPAESVDLLVALDQESIGLHRGELAPGALLIADETLDPGGLGGLRVPFAKLAAARYANVAALGVAGTLLGLPEELLAGAVEELFGKKGSEASAENQRALAAACGWTRSAGAAFPLPQRSAPGGAARAMINGNEALALGALSAGLRFCAFYPMTPSTSIPLTMAAHAAALGVVVEQAEDEIAAVNMAIGASFAGAPALVATSGGGFALMVEGVSLAAMTETPLVVVVAQRPGPATGLPTRTEQADLEFVLHAGHGEFARAILAPGSPEECFLLARKALFLAEMFQGPVFVLTDQFLADSYRAVAPFEVRALPAVRAGFDGEVAALYQRYAITEGGVSPRLLPGATRHLVVADSDEHTEDGHLTEDLAVRERMVAKRLAKLEGLRWETLPPRLEGAAPADLLLVSWGSSGAAAAEAAAELRDRGVSAATLHFMQLWPLDPQQFLGTLRAAKRVVFVEGNATGQFERLVRRETGLEAAGHVRRCDGLPITPPYILRALAAQGIP